MSPAQLRQLAANRPRTVQGDLEGWIQQAAEALLAAAAQIERKKVQP